MGANAFKVGPEPGKVGILSVLSMERKLSLLRCGNRFSVASGKKGNAGIIDYWLLVCTGVGETRVSGLKGIYRSVGGSKRRLGLEM